MEVGQKAFDYNKLLFQNGDDIAGATFGLTLFAYRFISVAIQWLPATNVRHLTVNGWEIAG